MRGTQTQMREGGCVFSSADGGACPELQQPTGWSSFVYPRCQCKPATTVLFTFERVLCVLRHLRLRQLQRLDVDALENDDAAEPASAPEPSREKDKEGKEGAAPRDVAMGRSGDVMMLSAVQEEEKKEGQEGDDPQPPVGLVCGEGDECSTAWLP